MEGIKSYEEKYHEEKKIKYKRSSKSKGKKNGFKVTVTNFYRVKTSFSLLSQEILQDLFIFLLMEFQENTKIWRNLCPISSSCH